MSLHAASLKTFSSVTDAELVRQAVAGHEDNFAELVRRYERPIASYVYRLTGNYETALDLTQEVFIKVYNALARYQPEHKFSTWIYRIAHNAAIDHLRRAANLRATTTQHLAAEGEDVEIFGAAATVASSALTPEQASEKAERQREIEAIVDALPHAYRELIVLRHAHDMNYDEIAEVTGLPLGTIKNRIFRAREMMRAQFLQRGITSF